YLVLSELGTVLFDFLPGPGARRCFGGRHRESKKGVPRLLRIMEGRRPRPPDSSASQSRIRQTAVREPSDELRREYCGLLPRVTTSFRFHEFADVAWHSSEAGAKKHPYNAGPWITGIEKRSTRTKNARLVEVEPKEREVAMWEAAPTRMTFWPPY